jgi:2-polyprenyl-3-methyl-5-hydroxy-6-metoxy-1,4-benzoquinol methylase
MTGAATHPASTLERVVPEETPSEGWLAVQVARYDFAAHYVVGSRLLDIACGSGHGTYRLASLHPHVECVGLDLDPEAVRVAERTYVRENARYIHANAMTFSDAQGFDTIVTLETIEHLTDPRGFIECLVFMLKPGGRIIASVPSTPSTDANPFHLQDFTEKSFNALFEHHGLISISQLRLVDPFSNTPTFSRKDVDRGAALKRMLRHYASHPMSLVRRIGATVRYGFENRYITAVWERAH